MFKDRADSGLQKLQASEVGAQVKIKPENVDVESGLVARSWIVPGDARFTWSVPSPDPVFTVTVQSAPDPETPVIAAPVTPDESRAKCVMPPS